ncbi:hypothetical protein GQ597_02225 [Gilliamella sp. Pra-s65]|uniref:AfsA-related hotdog domain-containing protein n=1 Tax=unclassified Gilliamella TaxID=2685620 RepID=UPI0013656F58|nr:MULTISPECIES: AfsA-related hotdog domain-containing protein [unclassified Gilliamella]MWN89532.1 hypothetical protein [Gilliamella sp. Pra-s65]MWP72540.1 hypothetical protein [Gilliamella sp. Pra-s52]
MCIGNEKIETSTNLFNKSSKIDRRFLHRLHSPETFLQSCFLEKKDCYYAKATIPQNHNYFNDHYENESLDFIFLLECARQVETYIAHAYYDIPLTTKFVLNNWSFNYIANLKMSSLNAELKIETFIYDTKIVKNILYKQQYEVNLYSNNDLICQIEMNVSYVPDKKYRKIRPNSDLNISNFNLIKNLKRKDYNNIVSPQLLSRTRNENVVISSCNFDEQNFAALLNVDFTNVSFFDHHQDHYPAMILMEVGRQLCTLYFHKTKNFNTLCPKSIQSHFFNYVEFDSTVTILVDKKYSYSNQLDINFLQKEKLAASLCFVF